MEIPRGLLFKIELFPNGGEPLNIVLPLRDWQNPTIEALSERLVETLRFMAEEEHFKIKPTRDPQGLRRPRPMKTVRLSHVLPKPSAMTKPGSSIG